MIAYILNIPCKKINKACENSKYGLIQKKSKTISIVLVYLTAALILFIIIRAIVPALYRNITDSVVRRMLQYPMCTRTSVAVFLGEWKRYGGNTFSLGQS